MLGISAGLSNVKSMKASAAWDVTKISGLFAWFKYNTGQTARTGDEMLRWGDEYGNEALTIDDGKVLINGGDVNFHTNNGRMKLESLWDPGSFSFYFVAKISTEEDVSNEEIYHSDSSNFFRINNANQVRVRIGDTTNNDIALPGHELENNTYFVIGIEWDGSTISIYQDTDYATPTTATDNDTFAGISKIGKRGNSFEGHIREMVMIDDVLNTADRKLLMEHLIEVRDIS